jgi:glycine/D-amino acid oxidase-like deaminating enzyme/nitrite reductase/ring-hydroxylating ferredoxin subunit
VNDRSSERSRSPWEAEVRRPEHPPLRGDAEADVCVVGAGIAGMSTAYLLAREGRRVIVVDKDAVGAGETGQTTAHLASVQDDEFHVLEKVHGEDGARLLYESHQAAIERIESITRDEGIDCGLVRLDGWLYPAAEHGRELIERELEAARRAGFHDAELLDQPPVPGITRGPVIRFPRQGQFHPLKYLAGLAAALERMGGRIHGGSHVDSISGGAPCRVEGEGFSVTANAVVIATNSPISDLVSIHTKQAPYRTFAVGARVPAGSVPAALYWDTGDPYTYTRLSPLVGDPDRELLIVGGEDVKTGHRDDADDRFRRLEAWARAHFPVEDVPFRWSGQVWEPVDFAAHIGADPEGGDNVYVATGDSGQGMTHGTIAGILLTDLIVGRENPWTSLYDPGRKTLTATTVREWLRENLDVAKEFARWATGGEVDSVDEIAPGHGAIVRRGLHKVAAFRAEDGTLHERSAACTHLGCVVQWNSHERSWDCPCHGSRFAPTGDVLTGPARTPLRPVEGGE